MSRSDFRTLERKKSIIYSDFMDTFDKNPITGFLAIKTNEDSVKQAIKNLILTNVGERFYDSRKGSKIRASLFELVDFTSLELMRLKIIEAIQQYEPRASNIMVRVHDDIQRNAFSVSIVFNIINIIGQPSNLNLTIQKVR